jgi:hypothetical protein
VLFRSDKPKLKVQVFEQKEEKIVEQPKIVEKTRKVENPVVESKQVKQEPKKKTYSKEELLKILLSKGIK